MVTYNSHIKNLRVALIPAKPIFEAGIKVGDTIGVYAHFSGGQFQTDNKEVIEKLEKLPTFGVDFWKASDEEAKPATSPAQTQSLQNPEADLDSLSRPELLEIAKKREIEVDEKLNKQEILDLLKAQ